MTFVADSNGLHLAFMIFQSSDIDIWISEHDGFLMWSLEFLNFEGVLLFLTCS